MVRGSVWMTLVGLALFLVPAVNGLVAGLIGGYRIGSMKRALLGALIAGAVFAVVGGLLLRLTLPHFIGVSATVAILSWVLVSEVGLVSGAAIGAISRPAEA
jgi:hypothetical protein